jgi:hypothetical protein
MFNLFNFLIPTPPIPIIGTQRDLGQRYNDSEMKLSRTARELPWLKEETAGLRRKLSWQALGEVIGNPDVAAEEEDDEGAPEEPLEETHGRNEGTCPDH